MSARGPLPKTQKRRRNAPTIPTSSLPVAGRKGRAPAVPVNYRLGKHGKAFWAWAWKTPQAAAWDTGSHFTVARRAQLEDDLAALDGSNKVTSRLDDYISQALGEDDDLGQLLQNVADTVGTLKRLAGGRITVMKEMRELDNKLGLSPESLARLRWKIVAEEDKPKSSSNAPKKLPKNVHRLPAVDPAVATG